MRGAARSAFLWPEEAAALVAEGRPLNELAGVGPFLARLIGSWVQELDEPPVAPEIRRGFLALTEARRLLAAQSDWLDGLRGDLQMHTTWSDGGGSVREMALAGAARGYEYVAITDHSGGLRIANGMDEAELAEQGHEIDLVNSELGGAPRVLRSIELNLTTSGEGDMDPSSLAPLDLVLGSFHSALRKTEDQTERYLAALRNPHVDVLAHPRGRMYDRRLGLSAQWGRVFEMAASVGKAVEIDCFPDRQDLDVESLAIARDAGVYVSIGTDAHAPAQLHFIELGLAAAIRAGIPRERILNFMPVEELLSWAG